MATNVFVHPVSLARNVTLTSTIASALHAKMVVYAGTRSPATHVIARKDSPDLIVKSISTIARAHLAIMEIASTASIRLLANVIQVTTDSCVRRKSMNANPILANLVAIAKILLVVINADVNLEHRVAIASTTLMNVSAILVVMELLVSMESTDTLVIASLDLLDSIARLTSTNVPAIHAQTEVNVRTWSTVSNVIALAVILMLAV